jgi:hypothetical protein
LKQKEANNTLIAFHCCAFSTIENAWGSFFFRNKLYHALEVGTYMALTLANSSIHAGPVWAGIYFFNSPCLQEKQWGKNMQIVYSRDSTVA